MPFIMTSCPILKTLGSGKKRHIFFMPAADNNHRLGVVK
jgi:hypothetical protein